LIFPLSIGEDKDDVEYNWEGKKDIGGKKEE
jgi:hypothetical protein